MAVGIYWAMRISTIGFQVAIPTGIGFWLDTRWNTSPWMVLVGAGLGFAIGTLEFIRLAREQSPSDARRTAQKQRKTSNPKDRQAD